MGFILNFCFKVPKMIEIILVPMKATNSQYPGLFIFTNQSRMMRPVKNLALDEIEFIGTFEQVYLNVCINKEDAYPDVSMNFKLRGMSSGRNRVI